MVGQADVVKKRRVSSGSNRSSGSTRRSPGAPKKNIKQETVLRRDGPGPATAPEEPVTVVQNDINTQHLVKLTDALGRIRQSPFFRDVDVVAPLTLAEGASVEPFDQSKLKIVFDKAQPVSESPPPLSGAEPVFFLAAANFFWQDFLWTPTPGVPINKSQMSFIKNSLPPENPPEQFPYLMSWAIPDSSFEVLAHKGSIQRLSPEEPVHQAIFSLDEAISLNLGDDILRRWRSMLLRPCVKFERVGPGRPRYWRSLNIREDYMRKACELTRTTLARIMDVVLCKLAEEKVRCKTMSSALVHKVYNENVKFAARTSMTSDDVFCETWIDSACTVYNRGLKLPAVAAVWQQLDDDEGNLHLLNGIYKWQHIISRAQSEELIVWSVVCIVDGLKMKFYAPGDLQAEKLKDPQRSLVELIVAKRKIRELLLELLEAEKIMSLVVKEKARAVFTDDVQKVRETLTPYPGIADFFVSFFLQFSNRFKILNLIWA